MIRENFDVT